MPHRPPRGGRADGAGAPDRSRCARSSRAQRGQLPAARPSRGMGAPVGHRSPPVGVATTTARRRERAVRPPRTAWRRRSGRSVGPRPPRGSRAPRRSRCSRANARASPARSPAGPSTRSTVAVAAVDVGEEPCERAHVLVVVADDVDERRRRLAAAGTRGSGRGSPSRRRRRGGGGRAAPPPRSAAERRSSGGGTDAPDEGQQVEVAGMDRGRATRHPVARDEQRPVEAAPVVGDEPGRRRDARPSSVEERRLVGVVGEQQLDLPEAVLPSHQPSPTRKAACRPPWRARSSPCRGRRAARPPAAGPAASRAAPGRPAGTCRGPRTGRPTRVASDELAVDGRRQALPRARGRRPSSSRASIRGRRQRRRAARRDSARAAGRGSPAPSITPRTSRRPPATGAPSSASRRSASALRVHLGVEARSGAGRTAGLAGARRDEVRARRRRARRGARTAAPRARCRPAPPRTGRSSAPPSAASGPG